MIWEVQWHVYEYGGEEIDIVGNGEREALELGGRTSSADGFRTRQLSSMRGPG